MSEGDPQTPDNWLMRWVDATYGWPDRGATAKHFLDIGSGMGANADWLRMRGHTVLTVDINPATDPDYCHDICDCEFDPDEFDCVLDINTLCHVEKPPFLTIRLWLRPGGIFLSFGPREDTYKPHVEKGKDFTRYDPLYADLRAAFSKCRFSDVGGQLPYGEYFSTWIAECHR